MSSSYFDFPYPVHSARTSALRKAALALGIILPLGRASSGATYLDKAHEEERGDSINGKPRELYEDEDTEQREGESDPVQDPTRLVRQGTIRPDNVEKPGEAAPRRR